VEERLNNIESRLKENEVVMLSVKADVRNMMEDFRYVKDEILWESRYKSSATGNLEIVHDGGLQVDFGYQSAVRRSMEGGTFVQEDKRQKADAGNGRHIEDCRRGNNSFNVHYGVQLMAVAKEATSNRSVQTEETMGIDKEKSLEQVSFHF
jgi:hypothetical protein